MTLPSAVPLDGFKPIVALEKALISRHTYWYNFASIGSFSKADNNSRSRKFMTEKRFL